MSGTSLDGIDAALILTDGERVFEFGAAATVAYDEAMRARLRGVLGGQGPVAQVERELTDLHAAAVDSLIAKSGLSATDIRVVGFHGHTILHAPERGETWQIGDGNRLAKHSGIDVVADFRSRDVARARRSRRSTTGRWPRVSTVRSPCSIWAGSAM